MVRSCAGTSETVGELHRRHLATTLNRSYDVVLTRGLLDPASATPRLPDALGSRVALLVTTPTVMRLYGHRVAQALRDAGVDLHTLVLPCSERTKTVRQVTRVCRAALHHRLDRSAALIALGGGVCLDIVTVAASWIRRGIGYVRIPTTLIGQIDAGLGVKGAVNFRGQKSYLGCFYPPEVSLLDPCALATLARRHLRSGLAEMIKIALIRDEPLFRLVEEHAGQLIGSGFQAPRREALDAVWRAAAGMLEELEPNLYENLTSKRLVDMGHTFSPAIEAASRFRISHGEAVAIDLALSTAVALRLGWLLERDGLRIVRALALSGLPVGTPLLTPRLGLDALAEASRHRRHLVLPTAIGRAGFIEADSDGVAAVLGPALDWLDDAARRIGACIVVPGCRRRPRPVPVTPPSALRASSTVAGRA
jgi:3-dehydroquinate synthase